jgi:hypothetical protein
MLLISVRAQVFVLIRIGSAILDGEVIETKSSSIRSVNCEIQQVLLSVLTFGNSAAENDIATRS